MRAGSKLVVLGAVVLGIFVGCDRDRSGRTTTTTSGSANVDTTTRSDNTRVTNHDMRDMRDMHEDKPGNVTMRFGAEVDRLATARCDREAKCNNIGTDQKFQSRDQCLASLRNGLRDELNQWDCRGGINTKELEECLTEIRNENCSNPLDTIGRVVACRSSDMCNAVP